jgi:hypothetical protein
MAPTGRLEKSMFQCATAPLCLAFNLSSRAAYVTATKHFIATARIHIDLESGVRH